MNWREFLKPTPFKIVGFIIIFVNFVPFIHYDTGRICIVGPCPSDTTGSLLMYLFWSNQHVYGIMYYNLIIGLIISYLVSCTLESIFIARLTTSSIKRGPKSMDKRELLKYILVGSIGFLMGGLYYYSSYLDYRHPYPVAFHGEVVSSANFGATLCGMLLGIASKDIVKGIKMAIGGMVGFAIGPMIIYPIFLIISLITGGAETLALLAMFMSMTLIGIIGGTFYGIVQMDIKKSFIFALFGGAGISIGAMTGVLFIEQILVSFMVFNLIAGLFLGVGMYIAEEN